MYRVRRATFLDFIQINNIYKNHFYTETGGKNTNLLFQFSQLFLNDFLRLFDREFLDTYCLLKNWKIVGVQRKLILKNRSEILEDGLCVIPEEREKGLAKFLVGTIVKRERIGGRKYGYSLDVIKSSTYGIKCECINFLDHCKINKKIKLLRDEINPLIEIEKYKNSNYLKVRKIMNKIVKKRCPAITESLFRPPKNKIYEIVEKVYFMIGRGGVEKYVIKAGKEALGYIEITFYRDLNELKIYVLYLKRGEIESRLLEAINKLMENVKMKNVNLHLFVKSDDNRQMNEILKKNKCEVRRIYIRRSARF